MTNHPNRGRKAPPGNPTPDEIVQDRHDAGLTQVQCAAKIWSTERSWQTGDRAFHPNLFVDVKRTIDAKKRALQCYKSEYRDYPHPRSVEAIEYLSRKRGNEVGLEYAEAFHIVRKVEK